MFEYILSTVARFRHSHTRMMTVLGEHVVSHAGTYSTGLPEGQSRQVCHAPAATCLCISDPYHLPCSRYTSKSFSTAIDSRCCMLVSHVVTAASCKWRFKAPRSSQTLHVPDWAGRWLQWPCAHSALALVHNVIVNRVVVTAMLR